MTVTTAAMTAVTVTTVTEEVRIVHALAIMALVTAITLRYNNISWGGIKNIINESNNNTQDATAGVKKTTATTRAKMHKHKQQIKRLQQQ
jgi:hypothetical protein